MTINNYYAIILYKLIQGLTMEPLTNLQILQLCSPIIAMILIAVMMELAINETNKQNKKGR